MKLIVRMGVLIAALMWGSSAAASEQFDAIAGEGEVVSGGRAVPQINYQARSAGKTAFPDFNGDGRKDVFEQPRNKRHAARIRTAVGNTNPARYTRWTGQHPQISGIDDWSRVAYLPVYGNFTKAPGDEMLLLFRPKIDHSVYIKGIPVPLSLPRFVKSTIIQWHATGNAGLASFTLPQPGLFKSRIFVADFDGDGLDEILFQTQDNALLVEGNGRVKQRMNPGYLGQQWHLDGSTIKVDDFNNDGRMDVALVDSKTGLRVFVKATSDGRLQDLERDVVRLDRPAKVSLAGETAMEFRVDESGNATVSVPLLTPPGTADVAPTLSLRYSSAAGNGVMGMGWSIGGLSAISRCSKNYAQDGIIRGILFNDEDAFCLDGQRLIEIERSSTVIHYRTQIANFSKVEYLRSAGYFVVETKAGERHTYGGTSNSLIENSSRSAVQTWALSRVQDVASNYIDFSYKERRGEGEFVIDRVRYTGNLNQKQAPYNEIHFIYESDGDNQNRPDKNTYYMAGKNRVSQTELLRRIEVLSENQLVRVYSPYYEIAPHTDRLRMTHLQECTYNGQCLKPLVFDWVDGRSDFIKMGSSFSVKRKPLMSLDFTGDGIPEIVYTDEEKNAYVVSFDARKAYQGTYFFDDDNERASLRYTHVKDIITKTADIDGDGLPELLLGKDGIQGYWLAYSFKNQNITQLRPGLSTRYARSSLFADVNGDGLLDYVFTDDKGQPKVQLNIGYHVTEGFDCGVLVGGASESCGVYEQEGYFTGIQSIDWSARPVTVTPADLGLDPDDYTIKKIHSYRLDFDGKTSLADFNGDGVSDLLCNIKVAVEYKHNSPRIPKSTRDVNVTGIFSVQAMSDRIRLENQVNLLPAGTKLHSINALDINSDGLSDLVYRKYNNKAWQVLLNQGGTFKAVRFAGHAPKATDSHAASVLPLDMNGDGKMEFVFPDRSASGEKNSNTHLWRYEDEQLTRVLRLPEYPANDSHGPALVADINGDGYNELALPFRKAPGAQFYVYRHKASEQLFLHYNIDKLLKQHKNTQGDLLKSITQGYGRVTKVSYRLLNNPDVYKKGSGAVFPVLDVLGAMSVVSVVTEGESLSAQDLKVSYHYEQMRMHAQGRGNLGFGTVSSTVSRDANKTVRTRTRYHQEFPLTGLPQTTRVTTTSLGRHVLQAATNDWRVQRLHGGKVLFPQQYRTQDANYFFNGKSAELLTTTTTSQRYEDDDNGNVSSVIVEVQENAGQRKRYVTETINLYGTTDYDRRYGRLRSSTVIKTLHGSTGKEESRTENTARFTYYGAGEADGYRGLLKSETIASGKDKSLSTTWRYDAFGNRVSTQTTGRDYDPVNNRYTDAETRSQGVVYDSKGRFVLERYNALNQRERMTYDRRLSQVTRHTDINGQVTQSAYDPLGRVIQVVNANGTWQDTAYLLHQKGQGYPEDTAYLVRTQAFANTGTALAPASFTFFNALGLEIEQRKPGFDGTIVVRKTYDRFARLTGESLPFYQDKVSQPQWTRYSHDAFDRVTRVTHPNGYVLESDYSNGYFVEHRHTNTGAAGEPVRIRREYVDGRGKIYEVRDYGTAGLGSRPLTIRYGFDAAEHLVRLEDDAGHVTRNTYDYRGHKTRMEDPNKGTWSYRYNAFGELKSQTDARQLVTRFDHDALGRSVRRVENATGVAGVPVRTTCSQYDSATHGIGKLAVSALYEGTVSCGQNAVAGTGAVALERVAHRYDQFGRSDEVSTHLRDESGTGSQRFTTFTDYEADTGRISQLGYPEGFTVAHRYRADTGFLEAVYNANTDRVYRTITAMDAFGNVTGQKLGNGVTESRVHDPLSGYLTDITASGTRLLMDWRTRYDAAGNVIERRDAVQNRAEGFQYDAYYRLTAQQVDGQVARTYTYDRLGNILSKTGAGDQYEYDASRPHAVARIRHRGALRHGLEYDANGNATVSVDHERGVTRRMDYSAFDKPVAITQGDTRIRFRYGASRNRYRRIDGSVSNGETIEAETTYIGKLFEQIRHSGGDRDGNTEYKFYVGNAVITETDYGSGQTDSKTHYLLGDHLGSVTTLLDESGEVVKRYRYDPFGEQYDMTGVGFFDKKPVLLAQAINRGFTGHEMLSAVGLIHMNGRIYDPRIGRFLQADPHVQDPKLSDNLNRYSYVLNNPLRYTDPSGYFFKSLKKHWRTIAAIAIAAVGGYYALKFVLTNPALAVGIAAGSGAVSGAISTGSLRGAAMGALTSVAFLGVGQAVRGAHWAVQIAAHGHMGGVLAGLQGGNYGHGFIRAGIAKGAQVAGFTSTEFFRGAFESAIVGGTASVLTGDKFANGAITAAFQSAMNNSINSALDSAHTKAVAPQKGKTFGERAKIYRGMQTQIDAAGIDTVWFGVAADLNEHFAMWYNEMALPGHVNELGIDLLAKNAATFNQLMNGGTELSGVALDNFLVVREQLYVQDFYMKNQPSTLMRAYINASFIGDGAIQPSIISRGVQYVDDKYGSFNFFDTMHRIELGQAMMSQRRHGVN